MAQKKKDFSEVKTNAVYQDIAEQTAEPETTEAEPERKRERKTYTEAEAEQFKETLKTAGHKGVSLPRINLAFTPANYDYVKTMAKISGLTMTEFINKIMTEHRETHGELYKQALEIRNKL